MSAKSKERVGMNTIDAEQSYTHVVRSAVPKVAADRISEARRHHSRLIRMRLDPGSRRVFRARVAAAVRAIRSVRIEETA